MSAKKPAPGARLQGLITPALDGGATTLPIRSISTGAAHQPRRRAGDAHLEQLVTSIREKGVLQPLLVRPTAQGHQLVAGERRLRAAALAGLDEVPVLIRALSDAEALEAALVENLQREGLEIIDEVDATLALVAQRLGVPRHEARERLLRQQRRGGEDGDVPTLEALFAQLGRGTWQSFVKNKLRILTWPEPVLEAMRERGIPYTVAGLIAAAPVQHHPGLIEFAGRPATKAEVRAEVQRLTSPKGLSIKGQGETPLAAQVARKLGSGRWRASLDAQAEQELQAWLKKMPERVRRALGEER